MKYVNFDITKSGDIKITFDSAESRQEVACWEDITSDVAVAELIEYQLCNGWEIVNSEEIGALTEALILSNADGSMWSNIEWYQIHSLIPTLLENGYVIFQKV